MNTDYHFWIPPPLWNGKSKNFSSKIFLTKVLFLKTKTSEYYLDSNSASRKLIKLSNHGTDCFSQPAHRSRIYVGCSQLWHCPTSLHLSGAAQAAERRQGHGRRPCTHGCCSRYVGRCNQERAQSPFFNSFAMDDRTQRVVDEIASIEAISHNTVKALSTVTTPLNVIVEMYIAGLEAKLQALRALVK